MTWPPAPSRSPGDVSDSAHFLPPKMNSWSTLRGGSRSVCPPSGGHGGSGAVHRHARAAGRRNARRHRMPAGTRMLRLLRPCRSAITRWGGPPGRERLRAGARTPARGGENACARGRERPSAGHTPCRGWRAARPSAPDPRFGTPRYPTHAAPPRGARPARQPTTAARGARTPRAGHTPCRGRRAARPAAPDPRFGTPRHLTHAAPSRGARPARRPTAALATHPP